MATGRRGIARGGVDGGGAEHRGGGEGETLAARVEQGAVDEQAVDEGRAGDAAGDGVFSASGLDGGGAGVRVVGSEEGATARRLDELGGEVRVARVGVEIVGVERAERVGAREGGEGVVEVQDVVVGSGGERSGRGRAPNGERGAVEVRHLERTELGAAGRGGRARDGVDARARGGVGRDAGRLRGHSRRRSRVARDTRVGHARQRERVCARASAPSTRRNRLETPLHRSNLRAQPPRKRRIVVVGRSKPRRRLDADMRPAQRSNTSLARNQPEFETSKERAPESGSVGEIFFSLFEDWLAGDL